MSFKTGYIALVGVPNAGKSTLLNRILGEKLVIVTDKPQTTRKRFNGIRTTKTSQMIFVDTPGVHDSPKEINRYMHREVKQALADADVICFLIPLDYHLSSFLVELYESVKEGPAKIMLILNKSDVPAGRRKIAPDQIAKTFGVHPYCLVSGKTGDGVEELLTKLEELLPEGEALYPEDDLTDVNLRDIAAEIIREKITDLTFEEIPYSVAIVINSFKEEKTVTRIDATVVVEQDSQKGIVVGKSGSLIKNISSTARKDIEKLLDQKVYLDLHVKVDKNWTKNPAKLALYGYNGA